MTLIHVFPGQGAQRVGMGRHLFERFPHLVAQAESVLNWSISDVCLEGPADRLSDTRDTQPTVYVVGALSYLQRVRDTGVVPTVLAGHSLGEYTALFAGGAFDFLTGLEIVAERGRLMAEAPPGGMAAVIGLARGDLERVLQANGAQGVELANINLPDQIVMAGPLPELDRLMAIVRESGASVVTRLPVSGAFHSSLMQGPARLFRSFLDEYQFNRLRITTLSNVTAVPHEQDRLHELLSRQMTEPVQWVRCMEYLLGQPEPDIVDIGPGETLSRSLSRFTSMTPNGRTMGGGA